MVASFPAFRALYHLLQDYQNHPEHADVYHDILLPWQSQALEAMSVLRAYGDIDASRWGSDQPDSCNGGDGDYYSCREHLYALSRISDLLLLPQQPVWDFLNPPLWSWTPESVERHFSWMRGVGIPQWTPSISLAERNAWLSSLGFEEFRQPIFHSFYHEIVEVEQSPDPDEPISLLGIVWPGFMLGQMMFCRAGVRVRGGQRFVRKDTAEHSHLYWAFVRRNRPADDRSHGWGHNSQWSTSFRRDYVDHDSYFYNVDGGIDIQDDSTGAPGYPYREGDHHLTLPMRIELVTNRCFIRTTERSYIEDFDDVTYREPK